jgi:hypothetical protein
MKFLFCISACVNFQVVGITCITRDQNYINDGIQSRWKSGYNWCCSCRNVLLCPVLPKYLTIKICFLHGDETLCLTMRDNLRLRIFENSGQWKIFGAKGDGIIRENLRERSNLSILFIFLRKFRRQRGIGRENIRYRQEKFLEHKV